MVKADWEFGWLMLTKRWSERSELRLSHTGSLYSHSASNQKAVSQTRLSGCWKWRQMHGEGIELNAKCSCVRTSLQIWLLSYLLQAKTPSLKQTQILFIYLFYILISITFTLSLFSRCKVTVEQLRIKALVQELLSNLAVWKMGLVF